MKNKGKVIVLMVLLAAVIAGAGALYPMLTAQLEQQTAAAPETTTGSSETAASQAQEEAPAVTLKPDAQTTQAPKGTPEVAGPVMRNMAKDFTCYDDAGNPVTLKAQRGKPVIVNFFASWCSPCKMEMPYFEECYKKYGDQVTFMMVNLCAFGNDTKENGKKLVEQGGWTFPVYFDSDGEAALDYAIRSMPTTIFVSPQGELKGRHTGMITMETLEKTIQGMLADVK